MRIARFGDHHFDALGRGGHQVNKFEQVSSDDHQMSLARGWYLRRGWVGMSRGVVCYGR